MGGADQESTSATSMSRHLSNVCSDLSNNQISGSLPNYATLSLRATLGGSNRLCGNLPDPRLSFFGIDLNGQVFNCSTIPTSYGTATGATCDLIAGACPFISPTPSGSASTSASQSSSLSASSSQSASVTPSPSASISLSPTPSAPLVCSPATFNNAGKCLPCYSTCASCRGSGPDRCISCAAPFLLEQGFCLLSCGQGYYQEMGNCLLCSNECKTCNGPSATQCTSCYHNRQLDVNRCK